MSDQIETGETPEPVSPDLVSPGRILREARERAQLSEREIAQALHMTVSKVKALESDDFGKLNVDTFVRGYLRSYANYLKLDCASLISAYEQQAIAKGLLPSAAETQIRDLGQGRGWSLILWLSGFLVVLLLVSIWFFGNSIRSTPNAVAPLSPEVLAPPLVEAVNEVDQPSMSNEPTNEGQEPASATNEMADEAAVPLVHVSSAPGLDRLELQFSEECWIEVSDAQGDVLATDLVRPGSQLLLEGRAPFSVKLGNAPAVSVKLNGETLVLNLSADTRVTTVTLGE